MTGEISPDGEPILSFNFGGTEWIGVIDTGFTGEVDLPLALHGYFGGTPWGQRQSVLTDGTIVTDDVYVVDFPFDGQLLRVQVSYTPVSALLIGTGLLLDYRLEIDFPAGTVELTRLQGP